VGDSGFEPLTSSASKKYDTLLEVSATCKIAANQHICALAHFPAFQEIHSGCCTVAAQMSGFASAQGPGRSLFAQPPGARLCKLRVRSVPRGPQSMSPSANGEAGEDCIPDCKECSSNCEDALSVTCTLN
jgi:hypothetical protein